MFLYFLLVCLKRRAENKIDNNGYQFQETYYLNRNDILMVIKQYTPKENKNADVFCKANNFCSPFLHLSREVVPHFLYFSIIASTFFFYYININLNKNK